MKKITLLLFILIQANAFSQSANERIQGYLNANFDTMGLTTQDINGWIVESQGNSSSTGIDNYYVKQRVNEIEVYGAVSNVWIKNGEVLHVGSRFISGATQKVNAATPNLSVIEGLNAAYNLLNVANPGSFTILEANNARNFKISNGALTDDPVIAELVYQPSADESALRLSWDFSFYTPDYKHLWSVRIDALDGKILEKHDMVISCSFGPAGHAKHNHGAAFTKSFFKDSQSILEIQSGSYRVLPFNVESPSHGPRELLVNPHDVAASPFGWHDTNGIAGNEYTITRGNNCLAQEDANGNNGIGTSPNGGAGLSFDFPYPGTTALPSTYLNASTTNLFYMTNAIHDVWYHSGFNESNGNFQFKNYTGFVQPGISGDAVFADAQDGSALEPQNINNANFSTQADGTRPRMQMFLWNVLPPAEPIFINSPADIAGSRVARDNSFNPGHVALPVAPELIQSDFVLYNDGSGDTMDACTTPLNAAQINGKIVVVRRGDCTFVEKVLFCQNAGATAVIVVNNVDGVIGMAGADASVTIPAISVTNIVGNALIARMQLETVNGKIQLGEQPFVNADGDFDNGIIAHEYGHGISNRLTGGAANTNCLNNAEQAGEGWSDWFALMMQLKAGDAGNAAKGIASFAASQPIDGGGIRFFPYSTDMAINPLTFADSNDDQQHNRGEVMAAVLWDLTWAYIDKYGFDPNVFSGTGGNNKVMRIVIDGLKLQPCSPTFIEYRNAVIAADQATTGGADYCMIWSVFARRGMGVTASSGSRNSATDQIENFSEPAPGSNCTLGINYFTDEDMVSISPNPSNGIVNIRISQFVGKIDVQVIDINGRVVLNKANEDFNVEKTINLSHLQSGMYLLKLKGESLDYTQKIIIN